MHKTSTELTTERPDSQRHLTAIELISVIFIFAIFLVCFRWQVFNLFSTHILGGTGGDTNLYFWLVNTLPQNLINRGWFETNSFYPYQNTLAWSDNFIFPSAIYYCLKNIAGINEIASWNILILLAELLNGFSVYLLARQSSANFISALLLGTLFIVSPYFAEQLGHPQLQFFFFIPLGLSCLISLCRDPKWLSAITLSTIVFLTFLTTVYYAISLALLCAFYFGFILIKKNAINRKLLAQLLVSAVFCSILLVPFLIPYFGVRELFGPRGLHEFYYFALSASSLLAAAPISYFYGATSNLSHGEAHFAWGLVSLLLLALGAKQVWNISALIILFLLSALLLCDPIASDYFGLTRNWGLYLAAAFSWATILTTIYYLFKNKINSSYAIYAFIALFFILIAIGPLGYSEIGVKALGPFRLFFEIFPGIDSLRAISRLGLIAILLFVLAAIPTLNHYKKLTFCLIALLLFESRVTSFPLAPLQTSPRIFDALSTQVSKDSVILIAPLSGKLDKNNQIISWSEVAEINSQYLVALRNSAPLLMNGYSGQRPKTIYELPRIMQRFPSQAALDKLFSYEKLKVLVVLGSRIIGFSEDDFKSKLQELGPQVTVLSQDGKDFLIELKRP